jgi:hypothetical protein
MEIKLLHMEIKLLHMEIKLLHMEIKLLHMESFNNNENLNIPRESFLAITAAGVLLHFITLVKNFIYRSIVFGWFQPITNQTLLKLSDCFNLKDRGR